MFIACVVGHTRGMVERVGPRLIVINVGLQDGAILTGDAGILLNKATLSAYAVLIAKGCWFDTSQTGR